MVALTEGEKAVRDGRDGDAVAVVRGEPERSGAAGAR